MATRGRGRAVPPVRAVRRSRRREVVGAGVRACPG